GPYVCEVAEPRHESALRPVILVHGPNLLRGIALGTGSRIIVEVVLVAAECAGSLRILLTQPVLQLSFRCRIELSLTHRQRHVRRPLKDGQVRHDRAELLNDLDSGSAGADDSDPLAGEVYPFLGPLGRVVQAAPKIVAALDVGKMRLGSDPGAQDQVTRTGGAAAFGTHDPAALHLVKPGFGDPRIKPDIPAQAELLVDIVKIRPYPIPGWVQLFEVPISP